jgi:hypothetical protein
MKTFFLALMMACTCVARGQSAASDSLQLFLPFANTTLDQSQNTVPTQAVNAAFSADRNGVCSNAGYFNGNAAINIDPIPLNTQEISISFWINADAYSTIGSRIFECTDWGNGTGLFTTAILDSANRHYQSGLRTQSGDVYLQSQSQVNLSQWYYVVTTYCNGTARLYINNQLQDSVSGLPQLIAANQPLIAGGSPGFSFTGSIDEIRLYTRCLAAQEMDSLYEESACWNEITVYDTTLVTVYDTIVHYDTVLVIVTDTLMTHTIIVDSLVHINTTKIYPNPAHDILYINTGNYLLMNGYAFEIRNALNQQIVPLTPINQQLFSYNLGSFTGAGLYYFYLYDPQAMIVDIKKIILQ